MGKKIAFFEIEAWEQDWLVRNLGGFETQFFEHALDEHHMPLEHDAAALCVGPRSTISREVLAAFPRLELIAVRFNECENIDFAACRERRIIVCRMPTRAVHAVAEFTFALILALSRKMCEAAHADKTSTTSYALRGFDLAGKTLGVLGTGNIGTKVIRIAKGFDMKVLAWNRKPNLQLASELRFVYSTLEETVAHAHILTLHMPYSEQSTHHLMNRNAFSQMRHGALLINTSHEGLIDTGALLWALGEGIVAGYASDVAQDAPDIEDLRKHAGVLLTPHIAWNTQETLECLLRVSADNICAYFSGFPQNITGEVR